MLEAIYLPKMLSGMIRLAWLCVVVFACIAGAPEARAQEELSDLVARVARLEETIRNLTGSVEQLQYRNRQLEQQLHNLQAALQARGVELSGAGRPSYSPPPSPATQYPSAPPAPYASAPSQYSPPSAQYSPPPASTTASAPPGSGSHDAFNPALEPNAPGAPRPLGASTTANEPPPPYERAPASAGSTGAGGAPLNLSSVSTPQAGAPGALPPPPPSNPSATGAMQPTSPPANTPKAEYALGYGYILHKDYARAVGTFRTFLSKYPGDPLTPEAQYWLGEALFRSQQYHDAAEAFLAVSTKYETAARAPDALLGLGQSLAALGQNQAACASLGEVLRKYPHASLGVRQSAEREQKRVHC